MVGVRVHFEATQTQVNGQGPAKLAGSFHDAGPASEAPSLLGSRAPMAPGPPGSEHSAIRAHGIRVLGPLLPRGGFARLTPFAGYVAVPHLRSTS
jgi:hypothetical protein